MSGGLFGEDPPPPSSTPAAPPAILPIDPQAPLAERMRPRSAEEVVGQRHLIQKGAILHGVLERGLEQSLILWGPPGTGKTTLARLIAERSELRFQPFSAVLSGIPDIRRVMKEAAEARRVDRVRTLLFVDEIHRFNKAQQDAFLPFVEAGDVLLVGATTENPSFELNSALLSRARVVVLQPLTEEDLVELLRRAVSDPQRGLAGALQVPEPALVEIARACDGDARRGLTLLETASLIAGRGGEVTPKVLAQALQRKHVRYDKTGEQHYDLISALHKSVRNSDPDAALYWLARMLEGGEDRDFLMRRITRIASEDVGLAAPEMLGEVQAAWETWRKLGSPEGELAIAQAVVRLAQVPKSNAIYRGLARAIEDVRNTTNEPVPLHLCNAPTGLMKALGYGEGYRYAHDDPAAQTEMDCLPPSLKGRRYLEPKTESGDED